MTDESKEDLLDYKNSYTEGLEIISNLKADLASANSMCMHSDLERDKAVASLAGARVAYKGQCAALEIDIKHWKERALFSEGAVGALEPQLKQAETWARELEGEIALRRDLGDGADGEAVEKLVQLRKYVGKLELKLREAIPIADSIDPDPYPQPTDVFEFVKSAGALLRLGAEQGSLSDEAAYAIIHGLRPEAVVRQELYDHGWIEDPDTAVMVWTEKGMWPLKKGESNE